MTSITPIEKRRGRPRAQMPALPDEILSGMSALEKEHFEYFLYAYEQAYERRYGRLTPTARINITQAGLDYIHLLRLQGEQFQSRKLVSQARQHPGVQLRAWLAAAGLQERDIEQPKQTDEAADTREALLKLAAR